MAVDVRLFFNFRSPYCYLLSKTMFDAFAPLNVNLLWRPVGGWDGRSPPERAKVKVPITRQDIARWTKRMQIPYTPPPITTDPTPAGCGSLAAEKAGLLQAYIEQVMHAEWGNGLDIGQREVLHNIADTIGLAKSDLDQAIDDDASAAQLAANWEEAQSLGVIGVPTFVIDDQIFWGNDRLDFVVEHLHELG